MRGGGWQEFEETVEERNRAFELQQKTERRLDRPKRERNGGGEHRRDQPIFTNERKVSLEDGNENKGEMSRAS